MSNKAMRIGYFGDGPWAHNALELLSESSFLEICFVAPRYGTTDHYLVERARHLGLETVTVKDVNSPEFIDLVLTEYRCDLLVSMSFDQIFRKPLLSQDRFRVINCHAGKLPFYRGRNVLNWVLINGESEFGITVHFVDEGIDTGDIILQSTHPITADDNYRTLLEKAYQECPKLLLEAIELIHLNKEQPTSQVSIHPSGMYCGRRNTGDEIIDWHQSSMDIYNFVRSICLPGPQARTYCQNKEVRIESVRLVEAAPSYKGKPGQVLCKTLSGHYLVKTQDSFIELASYEGTVRVGKVLGPPPS